MFASVALASLQVAIDRPYDYRIPDTLQDGVVPDDPEETGIPEPFSV